MKGMVCLLAMEFCLITKVHGGRNLCHQKNNPRRSAYLVGRTKKLYIGNLDAKRDWGFAPEYVVCQWLMLQQEKPDDYVIGTGESHSVREFIEHAFHYAGIEIEWKGKGCDEKGVVCFGTEPESGIKCGDVVIEVDPHYFRPTEVDSLLADASKAKEKLGWEPKITFKELVKIMIDADLELVGLNSPVKEKDFAEKRHTLDEKQGYRGIESILLSYKSDWLKRIK